MKRRELIKKLESLGAEFVRHGSEHDVYRYKNNSTTVPRHREIDEFLAKKIIKQLGL